jgi:protein involved in polysaccharide export with SLBB domain
MKSLIFGALALVTSLALTASAQVKSVPVANNHAASKSPAPIQSSSNTTRARLLKQDSKPVMPGESLASGTTSQSYSRSDSSNHSEVIRARRTNAAIASPDKTSPNSTTGNSKVVGSNLKPTTSANATTVTSNTVATTPAVTAVSSQIYRVGARDVLDIRLSDNPTRGSTLFTVQEDGVLEYPFAGSPIVVGGMTTPEIAELLRQRIKIFDNPAVVVSVRDYASHAVIITGFVAAPGMKVLRREAVPLYTILAEALVLPEAARATIAREGAASINVDLKDASLSSTLVVPGDAIKVSGMPPAPTEFFFIGGQINSPGQKPYHSGLMLTQAILASGGISTDGGAKVRVSRQGADGRLTTEEFNLRKIQAGKMPDAVLQAGDRIEVN